MFVLDENEEMPLYVQLYQQIKNDIIKGDIKSGTKLLSSRKLAMDLRISRNTVELAYDKLSSEGFLISRPHQGYYAELPLMEALDKQEGIGKPQLELESQDDKNIIYDFQNKRLHPDEFPFGRWKALTNKCFLDYKNGFLQYGCPFGEPSLRAEIQRHIYHHRQVKCQAKQIIIGSGTQFCLELICHVLTDQNMNIAMEEPAYNRTRMTFQNNGFHIRPIQMDEHGIDISQLKNKTVAAAYVTPSHQYPTGIIMPKTRRVELAEWAKCNDTFIIEDDYNCCFQYDINSIPSIHSFCSDRVIYMGTFSDLLFPAIGVSYMVLPEQLVDKLCERYCHDTTFVPFLTQKTLELFMREGFWEKHMRKTILHQRKKRDVLVKSLRHEFKDKIHIWGTHAGLHILVQAKWAVTEEELIAQANEMGVGVQPTAEFWSCTQNMKNGLVLLNYGGMLLEQVPAAVKLLRQAWLKNEKGAVKEL
ncbi:PLP-dependent aminotransferase family protein [Aminipila butyrica]|uniref:PLP-dependent aminotransferase family protein n=1 Tax=Aminipila butyrica TaxID=433296 RepID=A0A858BWG0_9FIRM|nr:PLP-dependent aminotransferase family protein [Aminipila butyrica]QIB69917.1 PLP-dependent aminotransferase family protein [Aminipila butyrica]